MAWVKRWALERDKRIHLRAVENDKCKKGQAMEGRGPMLFLF